MGRCCKSTLRFFKNCCTESDQYVTSPPTSPRPISQPTDNPPAVDSPTAHPIDNSLESIDLDQLIFFINDRLSRIKATLAPSTSHQSTASHYVKQHIDAESVNKGIKYVSKIIDKFSEEVDKFAQTGIPQEIGKMAAKAVEEIGRAHWIALGFSLVASVLERIETVTSNVSDCIDLLEIMNHFAQDLQKFKERLPEENEKLEKAVHVLVEGATVCCEYILKGNTSRFFVASTARDQLEATRKKIEETRSSLISTGVANLVKQKTFYTKQLPEELLQIQPMGITEQVEQVKGLLDAGGTAAQLAVILYGFGGAGKTTIAQSALKDLAPAIKADFQFSSVIIDENAPDKSSHIMKLQKDIINDFGGGKIYIRDVEHGRRELKKVLGRKSCFLFIDNVVDKNYVKQLLPGDLSVAKETDDTDLSPQKQIAADVSGQKQDLMTVQDKKPKLRILITSRQNNLKTEININCVGYEVKAVDDKAGLDILRDTILGNNEEPHTNFNEEDMMMDVVKVCKGIPLLLSVYGNHLRTDRTEDIYREAHDSLGKGNLDSYTDEDLSATLLFVYHKMKNEEAKEAFLDICAYFQGWAWDDVSHIVDKTNIEALEKGMLVNKNQANEVIVHDILRLMGIKEAKHTRPKSWEELSPILEDEKEIKNIKGVRLFEEKPLINLKSKHLNAMRNSLRVLILGDWVKLDAPCAKTFEKLRFLCLKDISLFPFKDISKFQQLRIFSNWSESGMNLTKLPPTLKYMEQELPVDHDTSATLPTNWKNIINLTNLQKFRLKTSKLVQLPSEFVLPAFLVELDLSRCKQLPKDFGRLTALKNFTLDGCDFEALPQGFGKLSSLKKLSMRECKCLTSLPEEFGLLSSLTDLDLDGCSRLKGLPENFGSGLRSLERLSMQQCEDLVELSEDLGQLTDSLQTLNLSGCINLKRLPKTFSIKWTSWTFKGFESLVELPERIENWSNLTDLQLQSCKSLTNIPTGFGQLHCLKTLKICDCSKLVSLSPDFVELSSLREMRLDQCSSLKELPNEFHKLPLEDLRLTDCRNLSNLPSRFGNLRCLRFLLLKGLQSLSSLPDGFGNLTSLRYLGILACLKLKRLSDDFQCLISLRHLDTITCLMLEGMAMDRIVNLESCYSVNISRSVELLNHWKKMQEEKEYPLVVRTEYGNQEYWKHATEKYKLAAGVAIFDGQCQLVDRNEQPTAFSDFIQTSTAAIAFFLNPLKQLDYELVDYN